MTATATATNGRPDRKQLADQLDRLDRVIDLLADNLNQAVADAVRDGARLAVKDAVLELLTNPDLRAVVAGLAPPATPAAPAPAVAPEPAGPGVWTRLRDRFRAAKDAVVARCWAAAATTTATVRALTLVMPVKKILAVGAGAGVVSGVLAYACPHTVSAVISGVCGAAVAVAAQVGAWVRRSAGVLGLVGPD